MEIATSATDGAFVPYLQLFDVVNVVVDPLVRVTPAVGFLAVGERGSDVEVTLELLRDVSEELTLTLEAPGYALTTTPSRVVVPAGTKAGAFSQTVTVSVESGRPLSGRIALDVKVRRWGAPLVVVRLCTRCRGLQCLFHPRDITSTSPRTLHSFRHRR